MLTAAGLAKSFGGRTLFEGVTLQLNAGSRYGVVGANGSGKSTLLKILGGVDTPSDGQITLAKHARIGMLEQDRFHEATTPIVDVAMQGDPEVYEALRALDEGVADAQRQAELAELLGSRNGYSLPARASQILSGLGIVAGIQAQPLASLSGGYQLRVLLAKVLVGNPELLLLDEPTNHLDIVSIRWLEDFLVAYRGCLVVVSHDQSFLNRVSTHILDVDYESVTQFVGNYDAFLSQRKSQLEQKRREIERAEKLIAEKKAFVERFRAKATKARQAQSRAKQIEKIEVEELKLSSRRSPAFAIRPKRPSGRDVLSVDGLSKSFGEKVVLDDVAFQVRRGERLGIVGVNGAGKSTLLKILSGSTPPTDGKVSWGHEARIGYFPQDHAEVLGDPEQTALQYLWGTRPLESESFIRSHLGRVLISGDDVQKNVGNLSGGEAARLLFAALSVAEPNVLLLDEPTNHLDFESIDALKSALSQYEGTLLLVSHNRWLVSQLCTRILEVTPDRVRELSGSYEDYLEYFGVDLLDRAKGAEHERELARKATEAPRPTEGTSLSWEEQKRLNNRRKTLPRLQAEVEAEIEAAEARKAEIERSYATPGFFERCRPEELDSLRSEEEALSGRLSELMGRWEALGEEQERLEEELERS